MASLTHNHQIKRSGFEATLTFTERVARPNVAALPPKDFSVDMEVLGVLVDQEHLPAGTGVQSFFHPSGGQSSTHTSLLDRGSIRSCSALRSNHVVESSGEHRHEQSKRSSL